MMLVHIPIDIVFTKLQIWSFNNDYVSGLYLFKLPIEEWLFFIVIPFCCVFIYESINYFFSFDKNFKLDQQKFSLTYYLSVGDQNCDEPGIFKIYEPDEEVLPSNGMIMIIPSNRKHSAVYGGKKDRVMIGINFYIF